MSAAYLERRAAKHATQRATKKEKQYSQACAVAGKLQRRTLLLDMLVKSRETGWWETAVTSKRWKAVTHVYKKLSVFNDYEGVNIPEVTLFAPELDTMGSAASRHLPSDTAFIYLAPTLEFESQKDVDHTVAHELAHVILGDHIGGYIQGVPYNEQPKEIAAKQLAAEWGFPTRKRGTSGFSILVNKFNKHRDAKFEKRNANRKLYVYRCTLCGSEEAFGGRAKTHQGKRYCESCVDGNNLLVCEACWDGHTQEMRNAMRNDTAVPYGQHENCWLCGKRTVRTYRIYTMEFIDCDVAAMEKRQNEKGRGLNVSNVSTR